MSAFSFWLVKPLAEFCGDLLLLLFLCLVFTPLLGVAFHLITKWEARKRGKR